MAKHNHANTRPSPFDIAGHAAERVALEEAARIARDREIDDIKWLMSDERGRRVMWRILDKAGVYRTSFTGNSETFFREGQRNIGLLFLADVQAACPEMHTTMLQEIDK